MEQASNRGRIESLQAVRALAFLGIVTFHCGLTQLGAWGVSVFLILSGFLLTYTYWDRPLKTDMRSCGAFAVQKIRKLYPLHVLTTWLALILFIPPYQANQHIGSFLLNCLLIQTWFPDNNVYLALNGVSWYLSAVLFLYAAFPLLLKRIRKITSARQALLISAGIWLLQWAVGAFLVWYYRKGFSFQLNFNWITYIFPVFRLGDLAIGACLAYAYMYGKFSLSKGAATVLEILTVVCTFVCGWFYKDEGHILGYEAFRYTALFTLPAGALVMLFVLKKGLLSNLLTCRPVIYLGNLSAYGFLIHQIVIRLFGDMMSKRLACTPTPAMVFAVAFPITLLLSVLWQKLTAKAASAAAAA